MSRCNRCKRDTTQWVKDPQTNISWTIRLFPTKSGSYVCTLCDPAIEEEWRAAKRGKIKERQTTMF